MTQVLDDSAASPDKQICRQCGGDDVRSTLLTSIAVYLRCDECGEVWSIPERRRLLRPSDGSQ